MNILIADKLTLFNDLCTYNQNEIC